MGMKKVTRRIETVDGLYVCVVMVNGREYRSPRNYAVRDAMIAALSEAVDTGAMTSGEAWEVLTIERAAQLRNN